MEEKLTEKTVSKYGEGDYVHDVTYIEPSEKQKREAAEQKKAEEEEAEMKKKLEAEKAKKLDKKKSLTIERTDTFTTDDVGDQGTGSLDDGEEA